MIDRLDHLVLTTTDEAACIAFYTGLLGMTEECFGAGRKALRFGRQKINIHVKGDRSFAVEKAPGARELLARLRKFRGRLPEGFTFDRDQAHERG